MRHGRLRFLAGAMIPPLALYGVFVLWPYAQAFYLAFTDFDGVSADVNLVWFDNFGRLWDDPLFRAGLTHTAQRSRPPWVCQGRTGTPSSPPSTAANPGNSRRWRPWSRKRRRIPGRRGSSMGPPNTWPPPPPASGETARSCSPTGCCGTAPRCAKR
jgi:hypothetical protein